MKETGSLSEARRSFFATLKAGMAMLGATAVAASPAFAAQSSANTKWQPARHSQDDWFDGIPGQHRLVFDTTDSGGMNSALTYATNYYLANQSGYGLQNSDLAIVVIARHFSTPFAFNDSIWTKYGDTISSFIDKNKEPSKANAYARQLNGLIGRGVHLAVCQMATTFLAESIAKAVNADSKDIFNEIAANLLPNSHMVAAGIVAVGRAQERGYSFVHAV
jgi:intracellular sulfur oxidation DsrE/DsrF family protein